MATPDRFDLEQCLMECWHTADDIELIVPQILDGDVDADDVANFLIGLSKLHSLRAQKALAVLEDLIASGQFQPPTDAGED